MLKWFSFSGIFTEIKRIRWPKQNELLRLTGIVLAFIVFFGIFFVLSEALIAFFLKLIGIGA
jgi:preprotein translocase SecE subunit